MGEIKLIMDLVRQLKLELSNTRGKFMRPFD